VRPAMKTQTKTIIILTVSAVFVLLAIAFVRGFLQSREALYRSAYKEQLDLAWKVVVQWQDDDKRIPATVTIFKDSNGKELLQSWRIIAYSDVPSYEDNMKWLEKYRFDEPWDSANNLNVAKTVADGGYNYFGATFGGGHDPSPTHAGILVVTGPGGAWLKHETQTKAELMAKEDKIAMVYLPDSKIELFEPKDITLPELIKLVKEKGKIHAYTAQGQLRVLDEEWADQAGQSLTSEVSQ
jgi:hypothetical protein